MAICVVTGSAGLVGSAAVHHFVAQGYEVVGFDNDMRRHFFGDEASTAGVQKGLAREYTHEQFRPLEIDIRDEAAVDAAFGQWGAAVELVVHCAAQPAHDWAARDPRTDFGVNARGTLNVVEAARKSCPEATFVHCSTSKVYGDNPNHLPVDEFPSRLDLHEDHRYWAGVTPEMSIDRTTHSLFGASKAAADLVVQEYGRYFGMKTVCFRPGCITGPQHAGAELHGFLAYLMKCICTGKRYRVIGYGGKQVRCNIHAQDLVAAFDRFHKSPDHGGAVYNIGGGRRSNCSIVEAILIGEQVAGKKLNWEYVPKERIGDHKWWISDNRYFEEDFPGWAVTRDTRALLQEMADYWALPAWDR